MQATGVTIGGRTYDITERALVMGILNRTPDSFYDRGATYALDDLVRRAEVLASEGADLLDVGGVKAGPGPEVGVGEELDRVVPAIAALHDRLDVPLSVDTWRASVAKEAYAAGAVVGNDISGFADPEYLDVAAAAGATVVATHIRLGPRIPDPEPAYDDVVAAVESFLLDRAARAAAAGLTSDRIVLDAGLDLGKTAEQSLTLLRGVGPARRPRLSAPALGVEQDVPRRRARARDRRAARGLTRGDGARGHPRLPHRARARGRDQRAGLPGTRGRVARAPRRARSGRGRPPDRPGGGDRRVSTRTDAGTGRARGAQAGAPAYLVKGDDPSLVAQAAHTLVLSLVGDADPTMVAEEFGGPGAEQVDIGAIVDACTTPPFLVDRRVVVVRDAGQLGAADAKRLVSYLGDPLASTALVLVAGGGTVPASLAKAVASVGQVVDTQVGTGRARSQWLAEHVRDGPVRLEPAASARLAEHLGEDMGRLRGLLDTLAAAYGPGATVTPEDLEPFLGEAGALAPWDLTDAVDAGDTAAALGVLRRMEHAGETHPLVVLTMLTRHFRRMLRLDGAGVTSPEQAAQLLGLRSAYPARKALAQAKRLGTSRIARAIQLLAAADLDLRGSTALRGELVLEVLVARLSRLVRQGG